MFSFTIRGTRYTGQTFAEISTAYSKARDESGEGASTFPMPEIRQNGGTVARLSYNGKIWPLADWSEGLSPLYNPYTESGE